MHSWYHTQQLKNKSISSKIEDRTRMSTLTSFIQHSFGSPRHSNQRRNTNERTPNWKEVKLLTDDIKIYTENPKDTTRKALRAY